HLGEDQGELFAAVTASDVFRASVQPEERCHLVQYQVARFVSESVVESFEVVDIDHQDGDGEPPARGASQLSLQRLFQVTPIEEARQRVANRQVAESLPQT